MEQISELLAGLTGILDSQVRTQITNNWPATPTAIIYANEKAYDASTEIMTNLHRVWRARASAICQLVVRNGEFCLPVENAPWQTLSMDAVQEQIDDMFAQEQSFRSMNGLLLVQVLNTAECADLEEFKQGYLTADRLLEYMGMSASSTMKIVLLDESGRSRALAGQIRGYLRQCMEAGEPFCKTTAILSNRLKNGVLLTGRRIRENYALAGNMILLANNSNNSRDGFTPKYAKMFPVANPQFITASYTHDSKPNMAICEVLLNATISWLEKRFSKGELLSADMMSKKLEITGGNMKALERFFQQNIADRLPPREVLEYLPRNGAALDAIGGVPFRDYDRMTMGGFSHFYKQSVLSVCVSEGMKRRFRDFFAAQVRDSFAPREAAKSITPQTVEQVLSQIRVEEPAESLPAFSYMLEKVKVDYYKSLLPICEEVLLEVGETAKNHIRQITEMGEEFQHSYMLDVDDTVQRYYHDLASTKLESGLGEQLLEAFNKPNLTKAQMLEELEQAMRLMFTSHKIFGMPLQEELTMRMGGNADRVQTIIQQELTDGLGDCIRLQTAIVPEIMFETMLLSKHDSNGEDSVFYDYLCRSFNNAECLDTGNSNAVEFVQLYVVDKHTL